MKPFSRLLLPLAALAALATPVRAGLVPVLLVVTPESGGYRWTYSVNVTSNVQVNPGDYFTVYNFAGLVPDTLQAPTDWAAAAINLGPTPQGILPTDDPALPNLNFTYTGATPLSGPLPLGAFSAESLYLNTTDSAFASQTHRTIDGRVEGNLTPTEVPVPAPPGGGPPPGGPPETPEPATLALAAAGLTAVAARRFFSAES